MECSSVIESIVEFISKQYESDKLEEEAVIDPWTKHVHDKLSSTWHQDAVRKLKNQLMELREKKKLKMAKLRKLEEDFELWLEAHGIV